MRDGRGVEEGVTDVKDVMLVQSHLDFDRSFEYVNELFAGMLGVFACLGVRCCRDLVGFHGP